MLRLGDPTEADLTGLLFEWQWVTSQGAGGGAVSAGVGPYPRRFQGVGCFSRLEKVGQVSAAAISESNLLRQHEVCKKFSSNTQQEAEEPLDN